MKSIYQVASTAERVVSVKIHNSLNKAIEEARSFQKVYKGVVIRVYRTIPNQEGYTFRETYWME